MSEAELIFTALAELSTRQIAESVQATGMRDNKTRRKNRRRYREKSTRGTRKQNRKQSCLDKQLFCRRSRRKYAARARLRQPGAKDNAMQAVLEIAPNSLHRAVACRHCAANMHVVVEIKQSERTVMEYLLSPVQKVVGEAGGAVKKLLLLVALGALVYVLKPGHEYTLKNRAVAWVKVWDTVRNRFRCIA